MCSNQIISFAMKIADIFRWYKDSKIILNFYFVWTFNPRFCISRISELMNSLYNSHIKSYFYFSLPILS